MDVLIATSNPHKIEEIHAIVAAAAQQHGHQPVRLLSLADAGVNVPEPVEDGLTFEANAILKARYYAAASGLPCIADDSGLEVDALDAAPGVHSARYSGHVGPRAAIDLANNQKLLRALGDLPAPSRTARFVCAMALHHPTATSPAAVVRGTFEGRILGPGDPGYAMDNPRGRGSNGFGYDPLFLAGTGGRTSAELSPEEKNHLSHRGSATRLLLPHIPQG